ncbi:MAG: hypothetical protein M9954_15395 [Cyclobacteriaceae bacterium]|nr:hypothetical protein [Cyclobacteriaceae bacterium]
MQTFAIENTGTADLNVSGITASGSVIRSSAPLPRWPLEMPEPTVTLSGANAGTFQHFP